MAVAEISMAPSLIGRKAVALEAVPCGEVTEADLALLASERGIKPSAVKRLSDRHHALARCIASGMRNEEASAVTGYDPSRISVLKSDPSFRELVAHYCETADAAFADFHERAQVVTLTAMNIVQERLEERPDEISLEQAISVVETFADRTGHAPVARSVSVSANIDLGGRLAAARARVAPLREVIEATVEEVTPK